jgi:hypothetical protein
MGVHTALLLATPPGSPVPGLAPFFVSEGLEGWLVERLVAVASTTYRANRLLPLGRNLAGGPRTRERLFDRPMGLFAEASCSCRPAAGSPAR